MRITQVVLLFLLVSHTSFAKPACALKVIGFSDWVESAQRELDSIQRDCTYLESKDAGLERIRTFMKRLDTLYAILKGLQSKERLFCYVENATE